MEGLLSVVGTPIGNLEDASPRVRRVLGEADVVLCEDTRVTGRLMSAFGLRVRLERCDENVMAEKIEQALGRLAAGERVAFVSDAGMPGVSDPGQRLVDAALDAGVRVEVVPGPSAVTCALVASGLASEHFFFEGFLPRKRGAQLARLAELAAVPGTLVVYESPRRVAETLANVAEVFQLVLHRYPGLAFCLCGHTHHTQHQDLFDDGIVYHTCGAAHGRTFLLFTLTEDGYTYEEVAC